MGSNFPKHSISCQVNPPLVLPGISIPDTAVFYSINQANYELPMPSHNIYYPPNSLCFAAHAAAFFNMPNIPLVATSTNTANVYSIGPRIRDQEEQKGYFLDKFKKLFLRPR